MPYMHRLCVSLIALSSFGLSLAVPASAQIPDDVMDAYRAYDSAVQEKDYKAALKHGKSAWKKAEAALGDSKATGDLAFNYGFMEKTRGDAKDALKALERGVELAEMGREKGAEVRLERSVELVSALEAAEEFKDGRKAAEKALDFAKDHGLQGSVFAGELKVHDALMCTRAANRAATRLDGRHSAGGTDASRLSVNTDRNIHSAELQQKCARTAQEALTIFDANPSMARPQYIALAANTLGNSFERDDEWLEAALAYQKARETAEPVYGTENGFVQQIIARWVNAYNHLQWYEQGEKAAAAGVCRCWPFDANDNKIRPSATAEMDVPSHAMREDSSGFAILTGDVTDSGRLSNIRVVQSWPEGKYVSEAQEAFEKYEFPAKTGDEPEGYRDGYTQVFKVFVYNRATNKAY